MKLSLCGRVDTTSRWRWVQMGGQEEEQVKRNGKRLCLDCEYRRTHGGTGPIPGAVKGAKNRQAAREVEEREKLARWVGDKI